MLACEASDIEGFVLKGLDIVDPSESPSQPCYDLRSVSGQTMLSESGGHSTGASSPSRRPSAMISLAPLVKSLPEASQPSSLAAMVAVAWRNGLAAQIPQFQAPPWLWVRETFPLILVKSTQLTCEQMASLAITTSMVTQFMTQLPSICAISMQACITEYLPHSFDSKSSRLEPGQAEALAA